MAVGDVGTRRGGGPGAAARHPSVLFFPALALLAEHVAQSSPSTDTAAVACPRLDATTMMRPALAAGGSHTKTYTSVWRRSTALGL